MIRMYCSASLAVIPRTTWSILLLPWSLIPSLSSENLFRKCSGKSDPSRTISFSPIKASASRCCNESGLSASTVTAPTSLSKTCCKSAMARNLRPCLEICACQWWSQFGKCGKSVDRTRSRATKAVLSGSSLLSPFKPFRVVLYGAMRTKDHEQISWTRQTGSKYRVLGQAATWRF